MDSWVKTASTEVAFFVNGVKVVEKNPQPEMTFLYYLRNHRILLCRVVATLVNL
jgi:xanthine dehydrogenase iron-sulfur cluster and FAD-binding subunit A